MQAAWPLRLQHLHFSGRHRWRHWPGLEEAVPQPPAAGRAHRRAARTAGHGRLSRARPQERKTRRKAGFSFSARGRSAEVVVHQRSRRRQEVAFYEVDAFVVYRISDPRRFREAVSGDRDSAESRLRTRLDAALRRVYGLRGFEAALSEERGSMMREVRGELTADAANLGISIEDVRIRRTDLTQEVSQQTFERMKAVDFSQRIPPVQNMATRGLPCKTPPSLDCSATH